MPPNAPILEFIQALPKAELHVHLEGCITPALALAAAERNNISLPIHLASLSKSTDYDFHDLDTFYQIYYANLTVLLTKQDFHDLALDYLTKAASQNIIHAEIFFDPQAHTSRSIPFSTIIEGFHSGLQTAHSQTGISASLIMCFQRELSVESAMETLESALPYKSSIIGIGLDSDITGNPTSKFAAVYERARAEGFRLTAHCDTDGPDILTHIDEALHMLKCERLDHGTNIVDSPANTEFILNNKIGLTSCPISNSIVAGDLKGKEDLELLRKGVKVTINSDDPAYFKGYVNENLLVMAEKTDVTRRELVQFERNAFEISWVGEQDRSRFMERLDVFEKEWLD